MNGSADIHPQLDRVQRLALVVGGAAMAACAAGAVGNYPRFLQSYLLAFLFWLGIALGSSAIVMLHHMTGGQWGYVIRRLLEAGAGTIPFMAPLMLPLLFSLPQLYVWARPEAVAADELLRAKSAYLNVPFFLARAAVYFAVWCTLSYLLLKWSEEPEKTTGPDAARRLTSLSAPGLLLYALTVTFASVDWAMSLEPHFFSTIYGMLFMIGQVLTAMAFVIGAAGFLSGRATLAQTGSRSRFLDLGNLMLAFVMLWAYISFSQFLIVWSGNLPEEITWYTHRLHGGWAVVALLLVVFHFALPFLFLLSRDVKRRARRLQVVAALILVMRLVDLYWVITPSHGEAPLQVHWMDVVAPVGLGGIWLALFVRQLKRRPLAPTNASGIVDLTEQERNHAAA